MQKKSIHLKDSQGLLDLNEIGDVDNMMSCPDILVFLCAKKGLGHVSLEKPLSLHNGSVLTSNANDPILITKFQPISLQPSFSGEILLGKVKDTFLSTNTIKWP